MSRHHIPADELSAYQDSDTLTVRQAAEVLDMDVRAIRGLVHAGVLTKQPKATNDWRIYVGSIKAFDAWLKRSRPAA